MPTNMYPGIYVPLYLLRNLSCHMTTRINVYQAWQLQDERTRCSDLCLAQQSVKPNASRSIHVILFLTSVQASDYDAPAVNVR